MPQMALSFPLLDIFSQRLENHLGGILQLWIACTGRGLDWTIFKLYDAKHA